MLTNELVMICYNMKNSIFIAFSLVILLKIISICHCAREPTNFELYGKYLPERIKYWKSKDYGLEITGEIERSDKLTGYDLRTQNQAGLIGKKSIVRKVDELLGKHTSDDLPDFTITKMDPMSYKFNGQNMLITFKNIKFYNFYTYDKETAQFTQTGEYASGLYKMTEEMYNAIKTNRKAEKLAKRTKIINREYYLDRTDVEWTIKLSSKFITKQKISKKPEIYNDVPIIIEAEFKIQPDPKASNKGESSSTPLRAKGVVQIAFHDFDFELQFLITHTDEPLREFFPPEKKVPNLVPDFKVKYDMKRIEIKILKLYEYDGDDKFPEKTDDIEEVNANLPLPKEEGENSNLAKEEEEKTDIYVEHERELNEVAKHFEELRKLVLNNKEVIERKLYLNLMPKMTWKIMKMDTKRQLPYLLREILLYDDKFQEKAELPSVPLTDTIYQGVDFLSGNIGQALSGVKSLFSRSRSSPT